jgi:hypothetical protein
MPSTIDQNKREDILQILEVYRRDRCIALGENTGLAREMTRTGLKSEEEKKEEKDFRLLLVRTEAGEYDNRI